MHKIKVIARGSRLSLLQVEEVFAKYPALEYELQKVQSYGDKHQRISLLNGEAPADIFTRELDEALLRGDADIAIHSAKDIPYPLPIGIEVIALYDAFDTSDSLVSRNHLALKELPAGATVGTSSPLRRKELQALRPDLNIVGIRGCIEERVQQVEDGKIDSVIVATCALKRLGLTDKIAEVLAFATHPLQGFLAITARKGRTDLRELFIEGNLLNRQGRVTLVGFGPGNPDLLTIAGDRALREADIIFHDDLIDKTYLVTLQGEKVYVGKRSGRHYAEQADINRQLLMAAREGKNVVRLKGGDPMLFAHAGEEIEFLQSCFVNVKVIPGITTASALAADAKVSLTQRQLSSSVAFVNGHSAEPITPDTDTIVYYMGASQLRRIASSLIAQGRAKATPVLLVHNVSLPEEKIYDTTLEQLRDDDTEYPTPLIALVGDVAALRHRSSDSIRRTLYTGLGHTNPEFIHTPLIAIHELVDKRELIASIHRLHEYDYLLFTSQYAVKYWFAALKETDHALPVTKIVSIGNTTTNALEKEGVTNIIQVEKDDSYGVLDYFSTQPQGKRILFPRSNLGLDILPKGLKKLGYDVDIVTAYNNLPSVNPWRVNLDNIQRVVFTSPSTIDNFIQLHGTLPSHIEYVTRGRITANHLNSRQNETIQRIQKRPSDT